MRSVALVLGVAVASFALSGCTPAAEPEPSVLPSLVAPTGAPPSTPPLDLVEVAIPPSCGELLSIEWVQAQFGGDMVEIEITDGMGSEDVTEYRDRGGLACMWGLPASEFGVTVFVAPRATATDEEQVALWEAAGYSLGPDFLDVTYVELLTDDFGDHMTVWSLVEGFELMAQTSGSTPDPLLVILREATENMGYV